MCVEVLLFNSLEIRCANAHSIRKIFFMATDKNEHIYV